MSKKQSILLAAYRIVETKNIQELTLDEVAKQAGVSKGGLLYHFPSKEALLKGMIGGVTEGWEELLEHKKEDLSFAMRYYLASFKATDDPNFASLNTTMVAARTYQSDLLQPLQRKFKEWHTELESEVGEEALLIRLICNGLWFSDLFGLEPITETQKQQLTKIVKKMTENKM
ncbi:TetR/AcrR family transcriptional regulator [Bacillus sp. JCM 19041]|uniref:TetR/AcrR family transcriptional regulator n=1 Tax=Bacillus sp. JCM 19041 TaxID=1460637 RepID=UPI0006D103C8